MADLKYQVGVETRQGQRNLNNLHNSVDRTTKNFARFRTALAAIATFAGLRSLLQLANQLNDVAAATGVTVQTLAGLGETLARNSGSFNQAQEVVLRFTETLGNLTTGNIETANAFQELGISLNQLRTLSESDLLQKTIEGLGRVEDRARRARLSQVLFGRSLKGVDLEGTAENLSKNVAEQRRFAETAERAGQVNQRLGDTMRYFGQEVLIALDPFIRFIESVSKSEEQVKRFVDTLIDIGKIVLVIASVVAVFRLLGIAITLVLSGARNLLSLFAGLQNRFREATINARSAAEQFAILRGDSTLLGRVVKFLTDNFNALKNSLLVVIPSLALLSESIRNFVGDVLRSIGILNSTNLDELAESAENLNNALSDSDATGAVRDLNNLYQQLNQNLKNAVDNYNFSIESFERQFKLQTGMLTLTSTQQESIRALQAIEVNYLNTVRPLQQQLNVLKAQDTELSRQQAEEIEASISVITAAYQQQKIQIGNLVADRQNILDQQAQQSIEEQRLSEIAEKTRRSTEMSAEIHQQMVSSTRDLKQELRQLNMTGFEQSIQRVNDQMDNMIEDTKRQFRELETEENRANVQLMMQDAIDSIEQARQQQIKMLEQSNTQQRSFVQGWKNAFKQYADSATNAARQAERIFSTVTRNMENSIVNFAKTGKFEFKQFAAVVLEELLRIQIQRTIAGIGSAMGGGSSSLFAGFFATGGQIPPGRFGVVGERGPELVSGPANVTPLGNTQVTYNISAVDARSFQQLVASDPGFIHSVAMQGGKSIPGRR